MRFESKSIKELNEKVVVGFMSDGLGLDEYLSSSRVMDKINNFVKDSNNYKFIFDDDIDVDECQFIIEKDGKMFGVYIDEYYVIFDEIFTFDD